MRAFALRSAFGRRFAWLLWLALLVPAAQVAAACHALSHLANAPASEGKQSSPHSSQCDLCLSAGAIGAGAAAADAPSLPAATIRHALPRTDVGGVAVAAATEAYRSRAPPLASR